MPLDASIDHRHRRAARGRTAYYAGCAAEDCVARHLERGGRSILARRWRGAGGEIDLVCREGDQIVFVEVKKARSFEIAVQRVSRRQAMRVLSAAEECLAEIAPGAMTDCRVDLALVDATGAVEIVENAFAWF